MPGRPQAARAVGAVGYAVRDEASLVLRFCAELGVSQQVTLRVLRAVEAKGVRVSHALAELLLYKHLVERHSFDVVEVEYTKGRVKCDVYASMGSVDMCVEVESYVPPLEHLLAYDKYILAKHLRKLLLMGASGVRLASFAYPYSVVPTALAKLAGLRGVEAVRRLARDLEGALGLRLGASAEEVGAIPKLYMVYIFDIGARRVHELTVDQALALVKTYEALVLLRRRPLEERRAQT